MRDYASNLCNASATSPSSSPSGSRPGRRRGTRWPKPPWARRRPEAGGGGRESRPASLPQRCSTMEPRWHPKGVRRPGCF